MVELLSYTVCDVMNKVHIEEWLCVGLILRWMRLSVWVHLDSVQWYWETYIVFIAFTEAIYLIAWSTKLRPELVGNAIRSCSIMEAVCVGGLEMSKKKA